MTAKQDKRDECKEKIEVMSMRGVYTNVVEIRQKIFTEVARMAYEGGDYSRIIDLPYKIIPLFTCCICF